MGDAIWGSAKCSPLVIRGTCSRSAPYTAVYISLGCGRAGYTGCPDRQVWTLNRLNPCLLQRLSPTEVRTWSSCSCLYGLRGLEAGTSLLVGSAGSLYGWLLDLGGPDAGAILLVGISAPGASRLEGLFQSGRCHHHFYWSKMTSPNGCCHVSIPKGSPSWLLHLQDVLQDQ